MATKREFEKLDIFDVYGQIIRPGDICYARIKTYGNITVEKGVYIGISQIKGSGYIYDSATRRMSRRTDMVEVYGFRPLNRGENGKISLLRNGYFYAIPDVKAAFKDGFEAGRLSIIDNEGRDATRA